MLNEIFTITVLFMRKCGKIWQN